MAGLTPRAVPGGEALSQQPEPPRAGLSPPKFFPRRRVRPPRSSVRRRLSATRPSRGAPAMPDIREVYPYLIVRGAAAAIDFYREVFGAEEIFRLADPDKGRIGHAELRLGPMTIMLADEYPELGIRSPLAFGGTGTTLHLHVDDVDALAARARPRRRDDGERAGRLRPRGAPVPGSRPVRARVAAGARDREAPSTGAQARQWGAAQRLSRAPLSGRARGDGLARARVRLRAARGVHRRRRQAWSTPSSSWDPES